MNNKKYQIFISSTYEDLKEERRSAVEAILTTNNIPVGMESFVASSQEQFEYIKTCIDDCDYYILIIGGRYGSLEPKSNLSYTELEFDYAKSKNKPILCFLRNDIHKCRKKDKDLTKITDFRNKIQKEHLCQFFKNKIELKGLVLTALTQEISSNPQIGWIRSDNVVSKFKTQKECIQDLIKMGETILPQANLHYQQCQQFGVMAGPFNGEYAYNVWRQRIKGFLSAQELPQTYYYMFKGTLPYQTIIKNQLLSLQELLAALDYKEILK